MVMIRLPRPVESFLSWLLAFGCLSVSGYHYVLGTWIQPYWATLRILCSKTSTVLCFFFTGTKPCQRTSDNTNHNDSNNNKDLTAMSFPCWLPLTSYSRFELEQATPEQRLEHLVCLLRYYCDKDKKKMNINRASSSNNDDKVDTQQLTLGDDELVQLVRSRTSLRRLATLAMRPCRDHTTTSTCTTTTIAQSSPLGQQLIRTWPALLALPPPPPPHPHNSNTNSFDITLVVPCYREHGPDVRRTLQHAQSMCAAPDRVQVVVVDAGKCTNLEENVLLQHQSSSSSSGTQTTTVTATTSPKHQIVWGELKLVSMAKQKAKGRGPALNFGAQHGSGVVYAFCHSDTKLPPNWDVKITQALLLPLNNNDNCDDDDDDDCKGKATKITTPRANSCAFGFGIDTSPEGLKGAPRAPPGIRAIETTANLRCRLWSLPYGDQCLCLTASAFHYLGGFPHQCFMEDYELVALLRKRVMFLPRFVSHTAVSKAPPKEVLRILPGPPVLCSPRRWQNHGVLYVTYTNSQLVHRYVAGMSPSEIYRQYYNETLEPDSLLSPWEKQVADILKTNPIQI
jgi:hypothetical protein